MDLIDDASECDSAPGVIYLSTIPTGMNVTIISDIMKEFGSLGRVYLVPKTTKPGKFREYTEGWVEFVDKKSARRAAKRLNCTEVPGTKRNRWFGELWNVKYLKGSSWTDLFGGEKEERELQRVAHDRAIVLAKKEARQFKIALETAKKEEKMEKSRGKRFKKRHPVDLSKRQKPTEEEILSRLARSHRTLPEQCSHLSALGNKDFMSGLFSGGL